MGYTDVFGGSSVQPADVAYRAVALSADVTLVWPPQSTTPTDFVARIMDVTPSAPALSITMPDARAISPGFDVVYLNPGANTYTVKDNAGGVICTVAAGVAQYIYLRTNATAAGAWGVLQFASLASAVNAASLVGPGIAASGSSLYATSVTQTFSTNYSAVSGDRTKTLVWTGGTGTLTLPLAAAVANDFYIEVANQGTGALTVARAGGDTIDGAVSLILQSTESCILHASGGTAWYSVGRGRNTQFNFTLLTKAVTGGTVTLSNSEAANVIQKYTGVLVSNLTVVVPSTVQVYYISNLTTGAFSSTWKTAGVGTTVVIPQGQNAVLFCDGLNVVNASTTVSGISSLTLLPGSAASPSINYVSDGTTGIYQSSSAHVSFTISGSQVGEFAAGGLDMILGSAGTPSYSFLGDLNTGVYSPGADQLGFTGGGTSRATVDANGNWFFNPTTGGANETLRATAAVGGVAIAAISGAASDGIIRLTATAVRNWNIRANSATDSFVIRDDSGATNVVTINNLHAITLAPTTSTATNLTINTANSAFGIDVRSDGVAGHSAVLALSEVGVRQWYFTAAGGAGTNAFAFADNTRGAFIYSISSSGNVVFSAPSAGRALAVNAFANAAALGINAPTAATPAYQAFSLVSTDGAFVGIAGAATQIINDTATGDFFVRVEGHSFRVSTNSGSSSALTITSVGSTTIAAPSSSSVTLALAGNGGPTLFTSGVPEAARWTSDTAFISWYNAANSVRSGYFQMNASSAAAIVVEIAQPLNVHTNGAQKASFTATGHSFKIADSAAALFNAGYLELPQNVQSGNYTAVLADAGKHIYYAGAGGHTHTIPANASVAYPIGTTLTFINDGSGSITIAINSDTLAYSFPGGGGGSRILAQSGRATAIKVGTTRWQIGGIALT